MKKTAIIFAAVLAATSICLASCNKDQKPTNENENLVENNNEIENKIDVSIEGNISFAEALEKIDEVETKNALDNETLITVGGIPVSAATVRYAVIASGYADNEDDAAIAQEVEEYYRLNAAIVKFNNEYNLPVTADEFNSQVVEYIEQGKTMHGEQYEMIVNNYMFQTPYFVAKDAILNLGYAHLYDYFIETNGDSEKKQEIHDNSLSQLKEHDYICAKHILIAFPEDAEKDENGNVTEAAKAETLAKATEVLEKVNAGEDFDALIAEYGEDPGMVDQPDGYVFTKGAMVPEFEEAAYALEIGETSGLVETTYGYHIILKLDLESDALYNSDIYHNVYMNNGYGLLREMLIEATSEYEIEYADNYQERVDEFITAYTEQMAAEAQAQADYEASLQAQAEAEAAE